METPPFTTRSQHFFTTALRDVTQVAATGAPGDVRRKTYGSLCHGLPIMVRTNGLCQALAFIEAKAGGGQPDNPRARAYQDMKRHVAGLLGIPPDALLARIGAAPVDEYLHLTRTVLAAAVYYKRFAVSILEIAPDQAEVR